MQVGSFESGVASIAAPVRDMSGNVVAAINATQALSTGDTRDMEQRIRDEVLVTAAAISRLLGGRPTTG
jgi:DNA-binding IclR family transcriptional regulator